MSQELEHDRKREATPSIRGYVYQAYQSILAWMRLKESEVLFLEGAEDFDIHEGNAVETTQVKDTAKSGSVTLRSPDVLKAINNLWRHRQSNPQRDIRLRFLTTAVPGQETGVFFGKVEKGLEYWELAARDEKTSPAPLKDFLLGLDLDAGLRDFLNKADDQQVRNQLIRSIHWDTGSKPKDALIAEIADLLVHHGDKRGVDTRHSEQALDSLLRMIADLLSTAGDRRLTYADFLRAFDEATMELMPRGEAAALRRVISRIPESGFALSPAGTAKTITTARILGAPLPLVREAINRESLVNNLSDILRRRGALIVRGSTGIGKTSVARLLSDKIGGSWAWAGFRGRDGAQVAYELCQAASELRALAPPLQIVLDDLDLEMVSRFEREFLSFAFSVINSRGLIVITGPNACPSLLLQKIWLQEDCNQEIPYLDENDIKELIVNHGACEIQQLGPWSRFILVTTGGHPQLAHARVRNLQSQNWPPVKTLSLLQTADLQQERDLARRRLMEEMPSESARLVAYRLSLITGQFSRPIAVRLAELAPAVRLPGEAFDTLVGPWIEKVAPDMYRVSPLLQNAGDKNLSPVETRAVHETVALNIAQRRTLSPHDFSTALVHAMISKSGIALGLLAAGAMIRASRDVWRALADAAFWFSSMALQSGQRLYETDPNVDALLRVLQFKIAAAGQRVSEALAIADRAIELVGSLPPGKLATSNATIIYSTLLMAIDIAIRPQKSIDMLSRLMDLRESDEELQKIWGNFETAQQQLQAPLSGLTAVQVLFTMRATGITGINDLDNLLDALENLDAAKRAHLLIAFKENAFGLADVVIGSAWWRDASTDKLDVNRGIAVLRRAVDLGRKWNVEELVRAAFVAISVLYDEYKQDSKSALSVLEDACKELDANDPKLVNQRAKVLYTLKQYQPALDAFRAALSNSRLPVVERIFSSRMAAICAARTGDWKAAEDLFIGGASAAKATNVQHIMAVGLMADAAFARWKQGQKRDSLALYADVLGELELIPIDQNLNNRQLHAFVRHCLGWIDTSGRLGDDDPLREPPPGACSNPDPPAGMKDLKIVPMPAIWGLLGNIDTRLGTALGVMKLAEEKYKTQLPIVIRLHERLAKYEVLWKGDDFSGAVPVIVGFIEAINCQKQTVDSSVDPFMQVREIPYLAAGYWAEANNRTSVTYNLLSLAILSTAKYSDSPLPLERWQVDLRELGISGSDVDNFFSLLAGNQNTTASELFDQAASALQRIRETSVSPQDLFGCHFRLLNFLASGGWGRFVGDAFSEMVVRQWLNVAENQRFALRSPSIYGPMLQEKCLETGPSGYAKAALILEIAGEATGVNVAQTGKQFLSRLKAGEFPVQDIKPS